MKLPHYHPSKITCSKEQFEKALQIVQRDAEIPGTDADVLKIVRMTRVLAKRYNISPQDPDLFSSLMFNLELENNFITKGIVQKIDSIMFDGCKNLEAGASKDYYLNLPFHFNPDTLNEVEYPKLVLCTSGKYVRRSMNLSDINNLKNENLNILLNPETVLQSAFFEFERSGKRSEVKLNIKSDDNTVENEQAAVFFSPFGDTTELTVKPSFLEVGKEPFVYLELGNTHEPEYPADVVEVRLDDKGNIIETTEDN